MLAFFSPYFEKVGELLFPGTEGDNDVIHTEVHKTEQLVLELGSFEADITLSGVDRKSAELIIQSMTNPGQEVRSRGNALLFPHPLLSLLLS